MSKATRYMVYSAISEMQTQRQFEADAARAEREGYEPIRAVLGWHDADSHLSASRRQAAAAWARVGAARRREPGFQLGPASRLGRWRLPVRRHRHGRWGRAPGRIVLADCEGQLPAVRGQQACRPRTRSVERRPARRTLLGQRHRPMHACLIVPGDMAGEGIGVAWAERVGHRVHMHAIDGIHLDDA